MEQFRDYVKEVENIVKAVGDGATASKINSHQCKRLASAYDEFIVVFKELVMLDNANHVLLLPLLDEFIRVLERGKVLVLQYASAQWYELAVTRGNNQEAFNEIHLSLDTSIKALQKQISSLKDVQFPVWTHDTTSQAAIFGRDAEEDFNEMLETLQDLGKNLPLAIAKLKGTPSGDELPLNMRIKSRKITLGKQIGEGAYGLVHEAYWLGCKIAVKIIETSEIGVLQQEVNNLAGLRHPNIVQLLGFSVVKATEEENNKGKGKGEDQGKNKGRKSMILMELMDEDLHHLIEDQCRATPEVPPFRQGVVIDIISQIAAGMAYLHDKGIFHGDLKASNVLVNHRGGHIDAKITDFGVSQKIQLDNRGDASSSDGLSDHIESFIINLHSDANRGESSVTIQRSLSDTNLRSTDVKAIMPRNWSARSLHHYGGSDGASSMYSGTSFSKVVGTTGWMAPEVYDTQTEDEEMSAVEPKYNGKADVYSFAITCCEVLTGKPPFGKDVKRGSISKLVRKGVRPKLPVEINTKLSSLIKECWETDPQKRPTFESICAKLQEIKVPSYTMIGTSRGDPVPALTFSPLGKACSQNDLTAVHEILVKRGYKDDELSFQVWSKNLQDMHNSRRQGDRAFREKDYEQAIDCYSQFVDVGAFVSPTVFARRSLAYLLNDQAQAALRDARQAQNVHQEWPTACYMQAAAFSKLGMEEGAKDMLKEGAVLDSRRLNSWATQDYSLASLFAGFLPMCCLHPFSFLMSTWFSELR
ncbi:hypothetical protein BDL97_08G116200 [Sphagnum fallax]|nr:hypothetical protein BDL97_08G116200 [Sphagnum fallax]